MPYIEPTLALVDFREFEARSVLSTSSIYPVTDSIPNLELEWTVDHFPANLHGKSLLVRLGLTISMSWHDSAADGTRFVITIERAGQRPPLAESEIARGDASALPQRRHGIVLEAHYGPIELPTQGNPIVFRARWTTLSGGESFMEKGDVGVNELRAYGYLINL